MNTRTRIKICGIRRDTDMQAAIESGADSIGLVFCEASPRHLSIEAGRILSLQVPPFVSIVALFLNPSRELVEQVLKNVQPEILQFHGSESADFCTSFGHRYLKAIAMGGGDADPSAQMRAHPNACGYVLDSHVANGIGGTGEAFDWTSIPQSSQRLVLAGGLRPDNVAVAINTAQPWAVDVSSGVEDAPGIKSAAKMAAFIKAVRETDELRAAEYGK